MVTSRASPIVCDWLIRTITVGQFACRPIHIMHSCMHAWYGTSHCIYRYRNLQFPLLNLNNDLDVYIPVPVQYILSGAYPSEHVWSWGTVLMFTTCHIRWGPIYPSSIPPPSKMHIFNILAAHSAWSFPPHAVR